MMRSPGGMGEVWLAAVWVVCSISVHLGVGQLMVRCWGVVERLRTMRVAVVGVGEGGG